jgi:hypothetical protein
MLELGELRDVVALDGMTFTVEAGKVVGSWVPTAPARRPRCAPCSG